MGCNRVDHVFPSLCCRLVSPPRGMTPNIHYRDVKKLHQSGVVLKQMFILELGDCVDFRVCARGSLEGL